MASQDWFDKDFYKVLGVSKDITDADLKAVIAGADSVWIQRVVDLDADDEKVKAAAPAVGKHGKGRDEEQSLAVPVLLTVYRDGRAETFGSAESVEIMILRAGGVAPKQRCRGCGVEKELLVHFGKKANKNNGRTMKCKACEAVRVKKAKSEGVRRKARRAKRPDQADGEPPAG
jgi:hypothetical protein